MKSSRDGTPGFEQSFQMRLGSLLESKGGLAPVAPVCVAARQQGGFGNPHAIFILTELHFRDWNDHNEHNLTRFVMDVKEDGWTKVDYGLPSVAAGRRMGVRDRFS